MRNIILCLALASTSSMASTHCHTVSGRVTLTPLPDCTELTNIPDMQNLIFVGECYKSELTLGTLPTAYGYSGVTSEELPGQFGTKAISPASVLDGRSLLTARSTFVLGGTRIYASEVIIANGDDLIEHSLITGTDGIGPFKNVTGSLNILGNSIGAPAKVIGEICK